MVDTCPNLDVFSENFHWTQAVSIFADPSLFVNHSQLHKTINCEIKCKNVMIIKKKKKKSVKMLYP